MVHACIIIMVMGEEGGWGEFQACSGVDNTPYVITVLGWEWGCQFKQALVGDTIMNCDECTHTQSYASNSCISLVCPEGPKETGTRVIQSQCFSQSDKNRCNYISVFSTKRLEHVSFSLNVFHKATRTHVIISQCSPQTDRNMCYSVSLFFHKATRTRVIISQCSIQKDWSTCYSVSMFFTKKKKARTRIIISQCSPQRLEHFFVRFRFVCSFVCFFWH